MEENKEQMLDGQETGVIDSEQAGVVKRFFDALTGVVKSPAETATQDGAQQLTETATADEQEKTFEQKIADERAKWEQELEEKKKLAEMTPEARAEAERAKQEERIKSLENQLAKKELTEAAIASLQKDGYPTQLANLLDYTDESAMKKSLSSVTAVFKDAVAEAVNTRLKSKTPDGLGGAAGSENLLRDQIAKNIRGGY